MITHYFYEQQLRTYIQQFCAIFYGLQVKTGKGECGEEQFITVPTVVGNRDRVVAAIMAGNTKNRSFSIPCMSAYMQSLELAPERRKNPSHIDNRVTMRAGGIFPEDLTVVKRAMPVPYNMTMELSVYASNAQQMHQILEQILVIFNPDVQIQKSDGQFDWTKITKVELTGINNEENYPMGSDRRMVVWTLSFMVPIFLSIPAAKKDEVVRKIVVQIGDLASLSLNEVDQNGELQPFSDPYSTLEIT